MRSRHFSASRFLVLSVVFLVSFATYVVTLKNGFVVDDHTLIEGNLWIRSFANLPAALVSNVHAFMSDSPGSDYYRPMLLVLYTVQYALFGLDPWGWHLVNVLFHALNSILVFFLASRLLHDDTEHAQVKGRLAFPAVAALLFAVHPLNAEAVSWLACICELSYSFFSLLSVLLFMESSRAERGGGGRYLYAASVALFFLATLSKETALVLPVILMALDYFAMNKPGLVKRSLPFWAAAAVYFILRSIAMDSQIPMQGGQAGIFAVFSNILTMAWMYALKLIWPMDMTIYNIVNAPEPADPWLYVYVGAAALLVFAVIRLSRHDRRTAALAALVLIPLAPTIAVLMKSADIYYFNQFAERYFYLPMAGISIAASLAAKKSLAKRPSTVRAVSLAGFVVLISFLVSISATRAADWKDDFSIWKKAVETDPGNFFARGMLGNQYLSMGSKDEAAREFKESIRLRPMFSGSHHGLGLLYLDAGMYREAHAEFTEVLRIDPRSADAMYNIGLVFMGYGRWDDALENFQKAGEYYRGEKLLRVYNSMAVCYARLGRVDETMEHLRKAYAIDPGDAETLSNIGHMEKSFGVGL